ncbi:Y+L amino acid transporter 2-like [Anneissia japonica]|uniref:Y+L amino acid transporter 2-like n=1 Tax=Anneissia japonica TaxID=1529436 RepID=UPI00142584CB|nr:Y+L amino acid transporter 2-like [Anneissia japonica]
MADDVAPVSGSGKDPQIIRLAPKIGLAAGVSINVGIMIGSGIFISPRGVLEGAGSVGMTLIVWLMCGVFSGLGALCYAELGTMLPRSGGAYAYIKYIYGDLWGFILLWVSIVMLMPVSFAVIALTFAYYCVQPWFPDPNCDLPASAIVYVAIACLVLLTFVNAWSVGFATRIQIIFTVAKTTALGLIIVLGLIQICKGEVESFKEPFAKTTWNQIGVAFYAGLFSYTGWYSLNVVVEEIKDPYRNLPRAIIISITTVTCIYVLTNMAYFAAMSPAELLASDAVAVTFGRKLMGDFAWIMPLAVALSTFGSVNGMLLSDSRIFFVGARDRQLPTFLSMINIHHITPTPALLFSCTLSIIYVFSNDVYQLINYFNFVAWTSSGFAVGGLLYLRWKTTIPRPYKVNVVIPIIFIVSCIALVIAGTLAEPIDTLIGLSITCTGFPVYYIKGRKQPERIASLFKRVTDFLQKYLLVVAEEPATSEKAIELNTDYVVTANSYRTRKLDLALT